MRSLFNLVILISEFLCCISAYSAVEITRTKSYNNASPKPKNSRRRLQSSEAESSTPIGLLFAREPQRRSQIESIWKWDMWCQLQPKTGSGSKPILAYYYDAQLDQCSTFGYSGSGGNRNKFQSLVECERHCKGTAYMTLKETTRTSFCGLQPNVGLCLALNERFYYDVNAKECKEFVYGGCGGNQNRFTTEAECNSRCARIKDD